MIPNADMGPLYKFDALSEVHKINFILDSGKSYHQDRQISINLFSFQLSKLEIVKKVNLDLYLLQLDILNLQYLHVCKFDVSDEHHHHNF